MDKKLRDDFISAVKKQSESYKKLKKLIEREKNTINSKDIKSLETTVKEEEKVINGIQEQENIKNSLFEMMVKDAGIERKPETKLRDVLAKTDRKDADEIEKAVVELIGTVKEIETVNMSNARVLKNYINYVDFVKNIKQKMEEKKSTTYSPDGSKKTAPAQSGPKIDKTI